jgi:hypothetical protein
LGSKQLLKLWNIRSLPPLPFRVVLRLYVCFAPWDHFTGSCFASSAVPFLLIFGLYRWQLTALLDSCAAVEEGCVLAVELSIKCRCELLKRQLVPKAVFGLCALEALR